MEHKPCRPQMVKRIPLGNGCLADDFPHEYGCLCDVCEAIWKELVDEDRMGAFEHEIS